MQTLDEHSQPLLASRQGSGKSRFAFVAVSVCTLLVVPFAFKRITIAEEAAVGANYDPVLCENVVPEPLTCTAQLDSLGGVKRNMLAEEPVFKCLAKGNQRKSLEEYIKQKLGIDGNLKDWMNRNDFDESYQECIKKKSNYNLQPEWKEKYQEMYNSAVERAFLVNTCSERGSEECNKEVWTNFLNELMRVDKQQVGVLHALSEMWQLIWYRYDEDDQMVPVDPENARSRASYWLGGQAGSGKSTLASTMAWFHAFNIRQKMGHLRARGDDAPWEEITHIFIADGDDHRQCHARYQQIITWAATTRCGANFAGDLDSEPKKRMKARIMESIDSNVAGLVVPTVWSGVLGRDQKSFETLRDKAIWRRPNFREDPSQPFITFVLRWNFAKREQDAGQTIKKMGCNRFTKTGKPPGSGRGGDFPLTSSCKKEVHCHEISVNWFVPIEKLPTNEGCRSPR